MAFPYGTSIPYIFRMAFFLIDANLKNNNETDIIKFFQFVLSTLNDNQNLRSEAEKLLTNNLKSMIED